MTLSLCAIVSSISDSDTLDNSSVNLDYVIPDTITQKLAVDMGSKVLDLVDKVPLNPSKWRHLCGVPDVHLWVVLDDLDEIAETDETNNYVKFPLSVKRCKGLSSAIPPSVLQV